MSQSFALCSEGGKFSNTTERSGVCEGEYKKNNSGHNTRKGEDGTESVESFIERPKMKEDMEWAINTDQQLSTLQ